MKLSRVSGVVAGGVVLAALTSPISAAPVVGTTTVVVRTVTGTLESTTRKLVVRDQVAQNELIATDPDAASEILFEDGTKLTLGPNAKVTLDKFVYDPNPTKGAFFLTLSEGILRFVTGSLDHAAYSIKTPNGTIGVRGTDIYISVNCGAQAAQKSEAPADASKQTLGAAYNPLSSGNCNTSLGTFSGEAYFTDPTGNQTTVGAGQFVSAGVNASGQTVVASSGSSSAAAAEAAALGALNTALAEVSFASGTTFGPGGGAGPVTTTTTTTTSQAPIVFKTNVSGSTP